MHWKHPSPKTRKFETQPSAGKVTLTMFWELGKAYPWTLPGEMWNSESWTLLSKEQRGRLSQNRNSTARQCPSAYGQQDTSDHPRPENRTPGMSTLRSGPRTWRFTHVRTFKICSYMGSLFERRGSEKSVHPWLSAQPKTFFPSGITKMDERGDYVENYIGLPCTFIYESWHIAVISWLNIHVRLQSFRTRFIRNRSLKKELYYSLDCNMHPS